GSCPCFRAEPTTVRCTGRRGEASRLQRSDQAVNVFLCDSHRRLVELTADPAHDRWRVGQLALCEQFHHAPLPARTLLLFLRAVDDARLCHVDLALFSSYPSGSHESVPCASAANQKKKSYQAVHPEATGDPNSDQVLCFRIAVCCLVLS